MKLLFVGRKKESMHNYIMKKEYYTALIIYFDDDYKNTSDSYYVTIHTTEDKAKKHIANDYYEYIIRYLNDHQEPYDESELLASKNNLEEMKQLLDKYITPEYLPTMLGYKIAKSKIDP